MIWFLGYAKNIPNVKYPQQILLQSDLDVRTELKSCGSFRAKRKCSEDLRTTIKSTKASRTGTKSAKKAKFGGFTD